MAHLRPAIALVLAALLALSGCDGAVGDSGQPGTVAVHVNGQTGSYVGVTSTR